MQRSSSRILGGHRALERLRPEADCRCCGVDIVNDGEFGKPSYATYVKDRLETMARGAALATQQLWSGSGERAAV